MLNIGRIADGLAFCLAGVLGWGGPLPPERVLMVGFSALLAVNMLTVGRLYSPRLLSGDRRPLVVAPLLMGMALLGVPTLSGLLGGPPPPWPWLMHWMGLGAAWLMASRLLLAALTPRLGQARRRRLLVVGDGEGARLLLERLSEGGPTAVPAHLEGDCLEGACLEGLAEQLQAGGYEAVIVALPWSEEGRIRQVLAVLREFPVDVHLFPDDPRPLRLARGVDLVAGMPLLTLSHRPLGAWGALVKAVEDRLLASLLVVLLLPLFLLIALAIRLDSPGPVLFRQKRYGFNNRIFTVYKFRSMYVQPAGGPLEQATRNDPRITRVGRFLRRSSLDELPQLFNVLGGSMSLVGPRPHALEHQTYYQHLVDEYRCRHRMLPGITGWAQVNGLRGETVTVELMRKRIQYDLYYIEKWSLSFDLWILFLTPFACLWGKNAY